MATFTGNLKLAFSGILENAADIGTVSHNINYQKKFDIDSGTNDGEANMMFSDSREIAASGTDDLDLYGGLTDAFGGTINFTVVKGILIYAHSTNTNNVLVGGDAAPFVNWVADGSDIVVVKPGGIMWLYDPAGYAVTNTTADVLQIANSAGSTVVNYDIILFGEV